MSLDKILGDRRHSNSEGDCATTAPPIKEAGEQVEALPLIKWTGGKRFLTDAVKPLLKSDGTYYEPFFGGGAVYFSLKPDSAVISDLNEELVNCYQITRDYPHELIKKLKTLKNSEDNYYKIRQSSPRSEISRAARFIYLCTLSFNGIYRVNLTGKFNVPYGKKEHLEVCNPELIISASEQLKKATINCKDFEDTVATAKAGDCVYFDPPYTVAHGSNGFIKYNEKIFSWKDQQRLEFIARNLASEGVRVVVSNADHPSLRQLYQAFHVKTVERWSKISAATTGRKKITECIFYLGGKEC